MVCIPCATIAWMQEEAVKESISAGEFVKEGITNYLILAIHNETHVKLA